MPLAKTVDTLLNNKTVAASGSTALSDSLTVTTGNVVALAVECKVTYNASATRGVVVKLYASPDDITYDTHPFDEFYMPFAAGQTISTAFNTLPGPKYIKAQVTNLDTAQSATAIYVYAHYLSVT